MTDTDPPPSPPTEPDPADCCGEGCPRCVYDTYEDALARYEAALAAWQARQLRGGAGSDVAAPEQADPAGTGPGRADSDGNPGGADRG